MPKIDSHSIQSRESIDELNLNLLPLNIQVVYGETLDPYTSYNIYKNEEAVFHSIYGEELIVKLAQLIPDSEVRLGRYEVSSGGEDLSQEVLVLRY